MCQRVKLITFGRSGQGYSSATTDRNQYSVQLLNRKHLAFLYLFTLYERYRLTDSGKGVGQDT